MALKHLQSWLIQDLLAPQVVCQVLFTLPSEVPDSVPPTSYPPLSFPPHFHACSAPPSCLIVCFYYVASLMPLIWIPWPAPLKLTSASESHQYACPTRAEALVSLSGAGILVTFLFACHTITVEKKKPELCSREIKKSHKHLRPSFQFCRTTSATLGLPRLTSLVVIQSSCDHAKFKFMSSYPNLDQTIL